MKACSHKKCHDLWVAVGSATPGIRIEKQGVQNMPWLTSGQVKNGHLQTKTWHMRVLFWGPQLTPFEIENTGTCRLDMLMRRIWSCIRSQTKFSISFLFHAQARIRTSQAQLGTQIIQAGWACDRQPPQLCTGMIAASLSLASNLNCYKYMLAHSFPADCHHLVMAYASARAVDHEDIHPHMPHMHTGKEIRQHQ